MGQSLNLLKTLIWITDDQDHDNLIIINWIQSTYIALNNSFFVLNVI